jgi:glycosyltransferase involved in cell wall biosynthesis
VEIMMDSLVTVIVPIYNVEEYLNRCVDSIVNQTYKNLEIILVDDGSPDNCPVMCDEWAKKDSRIRVIHKENAGLGMARNTGIENASGEYICFFDSDDYVDISIIEKCVLSAQAHNSDAIIYGRCEVYDDGRIEKKDIRSPKEVFTSTEVAGELLPAMFTYDMGFGVSAWGKMFSLKTIRESSLKFVSEREIISEDSYFALEFFSHASVVSIVKENLYFYYKRGNSLSRSFKADRHKQNDIFYQRSLAYAKTENLPKKVVTHLTARYHMYVISAMKQLVMSDLPKEEKKVRLKEMFCGDVIQSSLTFDTIRIHKKTLAVFFTLLKLRCYPLCRALLYFKIKNN